MTPHILYLGGRWRRVVRFTPPAGGDYSIYCLGVWVITEPSGRGSSETIFALLEIKQRSFSPQPGHYTD